MVIAVLEFDGDIEEFKENLKDDLDSSLADSIIWQADYGDLLGSSFHNDIKIRIEK